jgi:ankyrin repeat protein
MNPIRKRFAFIAVLWSPIILVAVGCQTARVHELLYERPTDYEEVEARLAAGANPNARNHEGRTLLWRAALRGDVHLVRLLLEHGADPDYPLRVKSGETALHAAALQGQDEIIEILLAEGVAVDVASRAGVTPLHRAARQRQGSTVRLLLDRGAVPTRRDRNGMGAIDGISRTGDDEAYLDVVRSLVAAGVPPDEPAALERTPLFDACLAGSTAVVEFLLKHGADPNRRDRSGRTPLMMAAFGGETQIVRHLLVAGADPEIKNDEGMTAFMIADERGHEEVMRALADGRSN